MTVGDIIVLGVLALVVGLVIARMIRDNKKGKSCGCGSCKGCSMAGSCGGDSACGCNKE